MTAVMQLNGSMPEKTMAGKEHRNASRICFVDDFLISN